jgi:hypothetical protein
VIKYLNSEKIEVGVGELFELLDISNYFMIDNLTSLLEIELEAIISKEINDLTVRSG